MNATNLSNITFLTTMLESGGQHAGEFYVGAARDKDGRQFLIRDYNYPVGFSFDTEGDLVLNSERLKGATKFQPDHDSSVKDAFNLYCVNNGLESAMFFRMNSIEKAMTLASLKNVSQNVIKSGGDITDNELISQSVVDTLSQLNQAVKSVEPTMVSDEDSLISAMVAAGMSPVRGSEQTEAIVGMDNVVKVTPTAPITETEDLARSEKLIQTLRQAGDLNDVETEMLEHLEQIVGEKRMRQQVLEQVKNDRSNVVAMVRGTLLEGPMSNLGLWRKYVA